MPGADAAWTALSCGMPFVFADESMERMDKESCATVIVGRQPLPRRFRQMSPFV